jgi:hypothetical protein
MNRSPEYAQGALAALREEPQSRKRDSDRCAGKPGAAEDPVILMNLCLTAYPKYTAMEANRD